MNRFTKRTTAVLAGFALVGAGQLVLVNTADAGSRGGVHYQPKMVDGGTAYVVVKV